MVNIELWKEHSITLGKLAVENRINKCEILTTGIRAVTGAVVTEFPKRTSLKRKPEESDESEEIDEPEKIGEPEKPEESDKPKQDKRRKNTTESEDGQLPNDIKKWSPDHVKNFLESRMEDSDFNKTDIKKIREQDLTGRAFLRLTEEKLTRKPGLYELKPEGIMELVEELNEKLAKK